MGRVTVEVIMNTRLGLLLKVKGLVVVDTARFFLCKFFVIGG